MSQRDASHPYAGLFQSQDWMVNAACRPDNRPPWISEYDWTNMFFPERGESSAEAEEICGFCPAVDNCLSYGMSEKFGIWGGLRTSQRRRLGQWDADVVTEAETILASDQALFSLPAVAAPKAVPRARRKRRAAVDVEQLGLF